MRPGRDLRFAFCLVLATSAAVPNAKAQVTVNPGALDLLPAAPTPQTRKPLTHPAKPRLPQATKPQAAKPTVPAPNPAASAAPTSKPTLPVAPPAIAALPPPAPLPPTRPQPTPTIPVAADAPGAASPLPAGLRVTFGAERQELNPATEAALRALGQRLRTDQATVNIYAYAEGTAEDPSTARRLALGRALAARAVLINEGVASTRIYPRSMAPGTNEPDKDRVDVVIGAPGPPAPMATP